MPEQFWGRADDISTGLSLFEFDQVMRGAKLRMDRDQQLAAWHAANIMGMWAKRGSRITPDKLLGNDKSDIDPATLARELSDEAARMRAKGGVKSVVDEVQEDNVWDPTSETEEIDRWAAFLVASARRAEALVESADGATLTDEDG